MKHWLLEAKITLSHCRHLWHIKEIFLRFF